MVRSVEVRYAYERSADETSSMSKEPERSKVLPRSHPFRRTSVWLTAGFFGGSGRELHLGAQSLFGALL